MPQIETGIKTEDTGHQDFHRCNKCGYGAFYVAFHPATIIECPYCGHQQPRI